MKAYILINVQIGMISEVAKNLSRLESIQSAEMTFGEYDGIAVAEVSDIDALAKLISREVQPIPGITRTITCMAVDLNK